MNTQRTSFVMDCMIEELQKLAKKLRASNNNPMSPRELELLRLVQFQDLQGLFREVEYFFLLGQTDDFRSELELIVKDFT